MGFVFNIIYYLNSIAFNISFALNSISRVDMEEVTPTQLRTFLGHYVRRYHGVLVG